MKLLQISALMAAALLAGCRHSGPQQQIKAAAYGTQIVEVGGSKQIAQVGSSLGQPVVVQVNGADGNPVTGALVSFHGEGVQFNPAQMLTDSSGQASVAVQLGYNPGDYQLVAETPKSGGGSAGISLREIALGYEQTVGKAVNDQYCIRCHDQESTPERVSNFDNLSPAPHAFTDGATLNRIPDADLINIITHGSQAVGKSPQSPAYGATLKPEEIRGVVSFIRAVADPPYQSPGVKYGK
jgi:mono/diheme cytochrome c family protein